MPSPLADWQNFYVIVGSASAGLTGLMFIVITLIASLRDRRSSSAINTFGTPTLIHFCAALFISALISVPWPNLSLTGLVVGLTGFAGVLYLGLVALRLRKREEGVYQPVMEDWLFHALLPGAAYAILLVAAIVLLHFTTLALFSIGAVTLGLLFIGIHNAWDTVTYIVFEYGNTSQD